MKGSSTENALQRRERYMLVALVFMGTMLSYVDRQVLALLKPTLESAFHWNDEDFAHLGSAFSVVMASAVLFSGWIVDRFGVRLAYGWAVFLWSLAGMAHAAAASVGQFMLARVTLALGETVSGPATVKATAEYLPLRERSLGLGIVSTAPSLGAILTPLAVPPLALWLGWQSAFLFTGGAGLIWVALWFLQTRALKPVAKSEPAASRPSVPFRAIFTDRRAWGVTGAKAMGDMVWWFMLFWIPDLFHKVFHLDQAQVGGPVALAYAMAALGALGSGALFPTLLARGWSVNGARKTSMLIFSLLILPLPLSLHMGSAWSAAAVIGVALLAHNGFVTNIFGLTADIIPIERVGTVTALGSVVGNLSGMAMIEFAGWSLTHGHGYWPMFALASVAYLAATLFLHLMVPVLKAHD